MQSRLINNAKLLIATLTFMASVGSLVVGTIAWFSASSFLEISRFRITMGEAEEVEIGLIVPVENPTLGEPGSIIYYQSIDDDILKNHAYYNPWAQFKAVSSMYQSLWLHEDTDMTDPSLTPVLRRQYKMGINRQESEPTDEGFYQFEFYVKSNVRIDLYLDEGSYVIADQAKNLAIANQLGLDFNNLNKVKDALRVSLLSTEGFHIWEPNVEVAATTEYGGRLDILKYDRTYDYDPILNREYMFGEYNGDQYLIYDESARINSVPRHSSFHATTFPGVAPLSIPLSKQNGLVIAQEQSVTKDWLTDQTNADAALLRLYPNEPQRLVVTIYAEGWDRDTTNDIHFANFALNLEFGGRYAPL